MPRSPRPKPPRVRRSLFLSHYETLSLMIRMLSAILAARIIAEETLIAIHEVGEKLVKSGLL